MSYHCGLVNNMESKATILVTGFGPFGVHKINSSWEAVKELANIGFDDGINLITKEVPVEYESVRNLVPKWWKDFMPKLCIHVGVSEVTNVIKLEKCASNSDYSILDNLDKCPDNHCCVPGGSECLFSNLDVEKICEELTGKCPCKLETSYDAGRYLCEFIYYTSLNESSKEDHQGSRVVFIHVPVLDNPYSKTQLAQALKYIVLEMMKEKEHTRALSTLNHVH